VADPLEQIAITLDNLQVMMGELHNAQLHAARPQVSEDILNNLQHQLEEVKLANVRGDNHHSVAKESKISMPDKFDGTKAIFHEFIQQVRLYLCLHPFSYPNEFAKVGFVGTLLTGLHCCALHHY
jgi:hypothetical protein